MLPPPAGRRRVHDTPPPAPLREREPRESWAPWFALAVAIACAWGLMLADAILAGQDAHHLQTEALHSRSVDTLADEEPTP